MNFLSQSKCHITGLLASFILGTLICAEPLELMSWNLQWFPGGRPNASKNERTKQMEDVKNIFIKNKPEILLAQELTDPKAFDQLVSNIPGMKTHVFSKFLGYDGETPSPQQCGIASTLKADSAWYESFKQSEKLPNLTRGFAFAALEHPEGGLIMLYSVHLKSNRGSDTPEGEKDVAATRAESARQLIAHKAEMEKKFEGRKILGWVIGGDFNTNHDGQFPLCTAVGDIVSAGFHNSWNTTPRNERLSWRPHPREKRFKATTFDYFLTSGFQEKNARMIPNVPVEVSDHAPIVIELELTK